MSHVFKMGNAVFMTGGSIIKVKDTITVAKQPVAIGFNYPQFIDVDTVTGRRYIGSNNTIKVFDANFGLITSVSIGGIVAMQLDKPNNRLIVTDKNTPCFWAVDLTSHAVTAIFNPSGIAGQIRFGYYDPASSTFYIGTNQIYIYSSTGTLTGMITDSRIASSFVGNLVVNPHTGLLMISLQTMILLADTSTMLVQATAIAGTGVEAPGFIRFDSVNPNSYWLCNTGWGYFTEMSVSTNAPKRMVNLVSSVPYALWLESKLGVYSIIIVDAGYNQCYWLRERLV